MIKKSGEIDVRRFSWDMIPGVGGELPAYQRPSDSQELRVPLTYEAGGISHNSGSGLEPPAILNGMMTAFSDGAIVYNPQAVETYRHIFVEPQRRYVPMTSGFTPEDAAIYRSERRQKLLASLKGQR